MRGTQFSSKVLSALDEAMKINKTITQFDIDDDLSNYQLIQSIKFSLKANREAALKKEQEEAALQRQEVINSVIQALSSLTRALGAVGVVSLVGAVAAVSVHYVASIVPAEARNVVVYFALGAGSMYLLNKCSTMKQEVQPQVAMS